jgi:7-carboxy-7-deazaguanine synthase
VIRARANAERAAPARADPSVATLRISEIFWSLQGESVRAGLPTAFVRLTGCPLRCHYCDTAYAFSGGTVLTIATILGRVTETGARYVTVTGGEPLAQPGCLALLRVLADAGLDVSLETSGALDISGVDPRVMNVVDLKTPGSGEESRNRLKNLAYLRPTDQIKIVVCDRRDYDWARAAIATHALAERCEVLLSPSHDQLAPAELAAWILEDRLPVRLQIQLHKVLWGGQRAR